MLKILLIFSETAVFAYIWINHYNAFISAPFFRKGNWFFYLVYIIIFSLFLSAFDALKYGVYRKSNLITAQILSTLATLFIIYLQIVLLSYEFVSVLPLIFGLVIDVIIILAITVGGNWLLKKLFPAKKTLIIYDEYSPETFIKKLKTRKDKFVIGDIVNVSKGVEKLEEIIKQSETVILYDIHSEKRNKILKVCFENDIRTYATTKVSDILVRGADTLHLFDTPLLLYRNIGLTFEQRFLKRLLDIVVSTIGLVITLPFMIITGLAIKLYDGGPIFYKQERFTLNGKKFFVYKFRSMIVNAESKSGAVLASKNDSRITPIGKIVRACRLDELPQFINVLKGDMSLVGPRPERPEIAEDYYKTLPEFGYRLKTKAGLTGYAQLYGKYNTTPYDKLQLDLMYIQNYSLFLDIKLILMTIKIMFMKESTEGVDENKKEEKK
jgi:exopolysaccharide biosynthesis polyprenyl glycosylphosphotransferase